MMADLLHLSSLKRRFAKLSHFAVWIFGVISVFLLPPPVGSEADVIAKFAQFVLTVAAGLVLVRAQRWSQQRAWIVTASSLVLSIAAFFTYRYLVASWTCAYFGMLVVVGTAQNLTDIAKQHLAQNPGLPCDLLLQEFGGQAELVWSGQALIARRFTLAAAYLLCVPLLVVCVIAFLQAIGKRHQTKAAS